jgi:SAM-dependent methyltransferase
MSAGPDWTGRLRRLAQRFRHSMLHPQWVSFRFKEQAAREVAVLADGDVLDIGCADSALRARLKASARYVGLDYPGTATALYRTLPGVFGDAQSLPFRDASFDTIVVLDVLEHLPRPQECLVEMARVLRPGGSVLLHVPFAYPLHDRPFDFWRFTGHGLETLAVGAGLQVQTVAARGQAIEGAALLLNLALTQSLLEAARRVRPVIVLGVLLVPVVVVVNLAGWLLSRLAPTVDFLPVSYWAVLSLPPARTDG